MRIGFRNWFTEFGTTPTHVGTDAGAAYNLADLAKPWRGAITRSLKEGTVGSPTYGAAGIEVTWPRAVPIRLIGILALNPEHEGIGLDLNIELRNGGSGGTIVGGVDLPGIDNPVGYFAWGGDDLPNNLICDMGYTATADYFRLHWYRASMINFDIRGLWASDALYLNPDQIDLDLVNDSIIEQSLAGGDYAIDRAIRRRATYSGIVESGAMTPHNTGDSAESFAELLNGAGRSGPVVIHRAFAGALVAPKEVAVHGLLGEGSGITKLAATRHRVTLKVEEL